MRVDLRALDPVSGRLDDVQEIRVAAPSGEETTVACRVALDYRCTGGSWFFHAVVRGSLEGACDLCAEPARVEVEGKFEVVARRSDVGAEPEPGGGFVVLGAGEHEVVFDEMAHEAFVVNMPMRMQCSDNCRGLCSQCGANLNQKKCECESSPDPRWDALKRLQEEEGA